VNTEVKDPYTGQMFLVPSPDGATPPQPAPDSATPTGKALRIMISSIDLNKTTLRDAIDLLQRKGAESEVESGSKKPGVDVTLKLSPGVDPDRKTTAKLANLSLLQAVRYVAAANDLVVQDTGDALVVAAPAGPLVTRKYQVPKKLLADLQTAKSDELMDFWKARGIGFPTGASVALKGPDEIELRSSKSAHDEIVRLFTSAATATP
jgi:hypothetical protein